MSGQQNGPNEDTDFSRRTFMKASGAVAGAGLLGAGAAGTAAASETEIPLELMNPRVQEAMQAWKRGYRGRADRSVGLTDSGADARHPAIGPWNGIQFDTTSDGFDYTSVEPDNLVSEFVPGFDDTEDRESVTWTGENVGAGALGFRNTHGAEDDDEAFVIGNHDDEVDYDGTDGIGETGELEDDDLLRLRATLEWEPENPEGPEPKEAELEVHKDNSFLTTTGGGLEVNDDNVKEVVIEGTDVEFGAEYHAEVIVWRGVTSYEVTFQVEEAQSADEKMVPATDDDPDVENAIPDANGLPQLIGWNVADPSWVDTEQPRDENSHGTHVSGIMTDSGRATTPDPEESTFEEVNAVLIPGEVLQYTVEADAGTGIFGTGYGEGFEIVIQDPDGRQVNRSNGVSGTSEERLENNMVQTPADEDGEYTVVFRALEGEALPARIESVGVGAFEHHTDTAGDVVDPDEAVDGKSGGLSLHSGSAPGASLVATVGLGGALEAIGGDSDDDQDLAQEYAETFNVRAVNMSWGFIGGVPLGTIAGVGDAGTLPALRNLAAAGVLPVGSAGNDATPATGNAPPAAANETISTVATDDRDGIASYSSGGIGAVDDEEGEPYGKPDVTAPGGELNALDIAAMPGDPVDEGEFGDERTYAGKGGTSMSAPSVTGLAALVSQALEEDGPDTIDYPEPAEAGREDAMRLKSVILSTASETAFTAKPYHASTAKAPVYTHGERDPYEGYGRVNFGAAIDAVTRDLLPEAADLLDSFESDTVENTVSDHVGLDVPRDPRAAAGYVTVRGGELDVDLTFDGYSGGSSGLAAGDPHLDLFVYDLDNVDGLAGEPTIVASDQGFDGEASVSVDIGAAEDTSDDLKERTFMVVAKIVNVPGVVNGFDVQANFDLDIDYTSAKVDAPSLPDFAAAGNREVDSTVISGRQANRIELTVEDLDGDAVIHDRYPEEWELIPFGDGDRHENGVVEFREVEANEVEGDDDTVMFTYYVEAPDGLEESDIKSYGPALALAEDDEDFADDAEAEFAGEDDVILVGLNI